MLYYFNEGKESLHKQRADDETIRANIFPKTCSGPYLGNHIQYCFYYFFTVIEVNLIIQGQVFPSHKKKSCEGDKLGWIVSMFSLKRYLCILSPTEERGFRLNIQIVGDKVIWWERKSLPYTNSNTAYGDFSESLLNISYTV